MPQKTQQQTFPNKGFSMKTFFITMLGLVLLTASFGAGYFTACQGYKVVDVGGNSLVYNGNAAQIVKEENSRLSREVIGKTEEEAKEFLAKNHRTLFIAVRDAESYDYKGQKTFTNLTVTVKDGKVAKVLGWY